MRPRRDTPELEALADEATDLRIQISLLADKEVGDDARLAQMLVRLQKPDGEIRARRRVIKPSE